MAAAGGRRYPRPVRRALPVLITLLVLAAGCQSLRSRSKAGPQLIPAKAGPVAPQVRRALAAAHKAGDRLLVYVGASWCDPCRRFKHAVKSGALAGKFPHLRLLAFDADRDDHALAKAGYNVSYIPALIVPGPDGNATSKHIEGSVKGPGAVNNIVPRLRALLRR